MGLGDVRNVSWYVIFEKVELSVLWKLDFNNGSFRVARLSLVTARG